MRRLTVLFFLSVTVGVVRTPLPADAQQPGGLPTIGFLGQVAAADATRERDAFVAGLRELGWVDRRNVVIEYRWGDGKTERLPSLVADLVRLRVGVIVTVGTAGVGAARDATATIPIVMAGAGDPAGTGLVQSLARPGGNITGLSLLGKELIPKNLQLLKEAVPRVTRVVMLMGATNPGKAFFERELGSAARSLGLGHQVVAVRDAGEIERAFATMARARADGLLVLADPVLVVHRQRVADLALENRLPLAFYGRAFAEAGGLLSYAVSFPDLWRRAASYVDKILKGAKPGELPIEQPTKFELVVNLKTARALGLTVPQSILIRADHVIQ